MVNSMFAQAVDQSFPKLDQSLKVEIIQKVNGHMLEFLKEEVYRNDPAALKDLNKKLLSMRDKEEGSTAYGEYITRRFVSLPENEQKSISDKFDVELTRVMHKIYLSSNI